MSSFTSEAKLEMLPDFKYRLLAEFEYHIGDYPSDNLLKVPVGYTTDLASIPRILWNVFPPNGKWAKAAIVHDYLYDEAIGTKKWADKTFYEAMGVLGVPKATKLLMLVAVTLFGKGKYKKGIEIWEHPNYKVGALQ